MKAVLSSCKLSLWLLIEAGDTTLPVCEADALYVSSKHIRKHSSKTFAVLIVCTLLALRGLNQGRSAFRKLRHVMIGASQRSLGFARA